MKISERIRVSIENDIRDGVLLPGDPIDEQDLARTHAASRTPVREALLQLQAQGLLISQPRAGMVVAKMDVQGLLAIWELLAEMEAVGARFACERMTRDQLDELTTLHESARAIVEAEDVEGWRRVNQEFHEVLYRAAGNLYLRQELTRLRARTGAYLRQAFIALGHVKASYEQHGEILAALQARDADAAHRAMVHHVSLDHGARGLRNFLINLPKSMLNP
ncbi:GntR family transcriptional regulator [Verticiella sediminum]|uniref:GntR family transcriptional regulator n=1 Tax=Verticiella sediminum TaxID=1247510 RepID=A0A556AWI6_9BURK|nr:GntR family transcriptional regulator [Verticiella sediminum]TSH97312.1 GntR family transcriptional regulator [Verticiella sediminum]